MHLSSAQITTISLPLLSAGHLSMPSHWRFQISLKKRFWLRKWAIFSAKSRKGEGAAKLCISESDLTDLVTIPSMHSQSSETRKPLIIGTYALWCFVLTCLSTYRWTQIFTSLGVALIFPLRGYITSTMKEMNLESIGKVLSLCIHNVPPLSTLPAKISILKWMAPTSCLACPSQFMPASIYSKWGRKLRCPMSLTTLGVTCRDHELWSRTSCSKTSSPTIVKVYSRRKAISDPRLSITAILAHQLTPHTWCSQGMTFSNRKRWIHSSRRWCTIAIGNSSVDPWTTTPWYCLKVSPIFLKYKLLR